MPSPSHSRYPSVSPSQLSSLSLSSGDASVDSRSSSGSSPNHGVNNIQLHYYLTKTQEVVAHGIRSYILWDIREHPHNAQAVPQLPLPLPLDVLNAYATNPPVASLNVICDYPRSWSTVVHASAANPLQGSPRAQGVRVADILIAIYNHIHSQPISTWEFNNLQPKQQARVLEAYEKRRLMSQRTAMPGNFSASSSSSGNSSTSGRAREAVKLVDTLLLHTLFAGMEVDPDNDNTAILSVKRPN